MAGLSISLALAVTQSLNWSVRMASDLESQMVSVERVIEYASLQQENPHIMPNDPPPEWPTSGAMEFNNVRMRYRPGLPFVLDGVNLSIKAREKIGVVGNNDIYILLLFLLLLLLQLILLLLLILLKQ